MVPLKPLFVACTGDLTDGMTHKSVFSGQVKKEWQIYQAELVKRSLDDREKWFDIPGNHDRFDVIASRPLPAFLSSAVYAEDKPDFTTTSALRNYYLEFSVQSESSYVKTVEGKNGRKISVIALDSS